MTLDLWEYVNSDESEPPLPANPMDIKVNPTIRVNLDALNTADVDFKEAISIRIDATKHPLLQINCLQASVHRLSINGVAIPEIIQVMILLSTLPHKWEMLISIFGHGTVGKQEEQRETPTAAAAAECSKLSTVKHKRGDPNYKQQCGTGNGNGSGSGQKNSQQSGQGNSQGKKKHGKHRGKKVSQLQQEQETHDHSHLASKAALPVPKMSTVAHFTPGGKSVHTISGCTLFTPKKGMYSTFNKTLEEHITPLDLDDSDEDNNHTSKCNKSSPKPSDQENTKDNLFSRSPTPNVQDETVEDCVSFGDNDWDVNTMACDAAGLLDFGIYNVTCELHVSLT
ncbi:hypothetical protein EI94DRAFT_1800724 [Lactarius quietus]|nr:hypothetical protein EI94DRAFT_1800724 [Lactarius quietus]